MLTPALPAPDDAARRHSARLVAELQAQIRRRDWLAFDDFMHAALYAPGLGYYQAGLPKFAAPAAAGDFVTAAGLGDLTARCMARQCAEVLAHIDGGDGRDILEVGGGRSPHRHPRNTPHRHPRSLLSGGGDILEVGGGDGRFAADMLTALAHLDSPPAAYCILETSAELRARQRRAVGELPAELRRRVRWLDALPAAREFTGVIVAVEALDAMPVARFEIAADGRARALGVGLGDRHSHSGAGDDSSFRWSTAAPLPAGLQRRVADALGDAAAPGYRSEINLRAEAWTRAAGESLRRGALLIVDYGFPRREFYHPQRRDGTLMCHYRHLAHADPFFYPGLQDITAHVDFTAIADAARAAGLTLAGYTSQAAFLLALGALELAAGDAPLRHPRSPHPRHPRSLLSGGDAAVHRARAQELGRLTLPHEMGELFKVAAFTRDYDRPLTGFALKDRSAAI